MTNASEATCAAAAGGESLPSGTVTFAFTDIEGSTVRRERNRDAMQDAVRRHDAIVRDAIVSRGGHVFKTIGDAFCAAFHRPENAMGAMLDAQLALASEDFTAADGVRIRAAVPEGAFALVAIQHLALAIASTGDLERAALLDGYAERAFEA